MSAMLRFSGTLAASMAALLLTGAGDSQPNSDVTGWWQATVSHDGQSDDIYLHFQTRGSKQVASFSIPSVATDDYPLSLYSASAAEVNLNSIGWVLKRAPDGSLRGTLSRQLVPAYDFPAVFRRSEPPRLWMPARPTRSPPKPLWQQQLGAAVYGGIGYDSAGRHMLVATVAGELAALDPRTGKRAWSASLLAPIRAAPVALGDAVFVATDASVVKLDRRTGQSLWTSPLGKPRTPIKALTDLSDFNSRWTHYSAAPIIRAGIVYVASRDGCVHALNTSDGSKVRDYCGDEEITGAPVIDANRLYYPSFNGNIYAVRLSDGAPVWKYDTHGALPRDLVLAGDRLLAASRSYDLVAVDKRSGTARWKMHSWWGWVDSVPEVHSRDLVIGSSDAQRIYDVDTATGRPIWQTFVGGWAWARPTRDGNSVYAGLVGTEQHYVGKRRGGLAALDARTGRLKWLLETQHTDGVAAYGFASAPLVVGGILYAADLNGTVFALPAN